MSNRRIVSVAAVSTSGTAYTGRADGLFSTNDQAKLKQAGVWPTAISKPSAPTAASATAGSLQATVSFTTPSSLNGETIISYTVTSSPGSVTATGASSPITVSGLTANTSYTFTVVANTASGASLSSSASSSVTVLTVAYSDDVFSTYLYTGNSSTQTIVNGIDLAGQGGMVWIKGRSVVSSNTIYDTSRGVSSRLITNVTNGTFAGNLTSFNSTGFTLSAANAGELINATNDSMVSWTFRKAPNFFDIVTYTGNGTNRTIAHSLGIAPGMIIVKRTDTASDWQVYHNGLSSAAASIQLNLSAPEAAASTVWNSTAPTTSVFSVGTDATVNASGGTYVAYLYAHDTSSTGIIQCGTFGTNSSAYTNLQQTLGWEAQFLLIKQVRWNTGHDWQIIDTMRGWNTISSGAGQANVLKPNTSAAEVANGLAMRLLSNGFLGYPPGLAPSSTYIYMAIRRPNKPPTSGAQVFNVNTISFGGAIGL